MEIKSASGGSESSLFAGDLVDMYQNFCIKNGWEWKVIDLHADFVVGKGCKSGKNNYN